MPNSSYQFISDKVLRQNIESTFTHILTIIPLSKDVSYNQEAQSAFRKTILIHTAAIVEALLFHLLDIQFTDQEIAEHHSIWGFKNKKVLYQIDSTHQIVAGLEEKVLSKTSKNKMNLGQIGNFLKDKAVIDKITHNKIDQLRRLRNEQHLGTQKETKTYSVSDLETAFAIAKDIKELVRVKLTL